MKSSLVSAWTNRGEPIQMSDCTHSNEGTPAPRPNAADMDFMSLMGRQIAVRVPSHRSGWVCDGANGHPTAFRLSQVDTKRIIATHSISAKLPVSADIVTTLSCLKNRAAMRRLPLTTNMHPEDRSMASPLQPGSDVHEHAARPHRHRPEPRPAITKASNKFIHERLHHAPLHQAT